MIQYATITMPGGREINEDAVAVCQKDEILFAALADGLGGHGAGEVASALAIETVTQMFESCTDIDAALLPDAVMAAQDALMEKQRTTGRMNDMKTTLVLLLIRAEMAVWAHVGDSRLYRFEGAVVAEHTLDHSVPQMLVAQGEIRERDIRNHEDRNRLTRVLGMEWETPKYTLSTGEAFTAPQSYLLCSDGFWELIDEKEMCRTLKRSETPEEWLAAMEQIVLKNGRNKNMDNYSAVAVFVR